MGVGCLGMIKGSGWGCWAVRSELLGSIIMNY